MEVLRLRHDDYAGPAGRTVTLRALALPLRELAPLVEPGGRLLVFGGRPAAARPFGLEETRPIGQGRLYVFLRAVAGRECFTGNLTVKQHSWHHRSPR